MPDLMASWAFFTARIIISSSVAVRASLALKVSPVLTQVHVGVHQAGHDGLVAGVDHLHPRLGRHGFLASHRHDPAIFDQHRRVIQRAAFAVQ
jgi:hypothetical protein